MSSVKRRSTTWKGLKETKNLFVFGDSYAAVGFGLRLRALESDQPTGANPLGEVFPGSTWNEPGEPNWVGHLITTYYPGPKYKPGCSEQDEAHSSVPLLVYDYAVGGATVSGVRQQIQRRYLQEAGANPRPSWARWTRDDALFVTWVGINDCAWRKEHAGDINMLMEAQEELYQSGARNFLFIDVPPMHRSPSGLRFSAKPDSTLNWNAELAQGLAKFAGSHKDSSVFCFSSRDLFTRVLDAPESYGFAGEDASRESGAIWYDRLHATSKMHGVIAEGIAEFLSSI